MDIDHKPDHLVCVTIDTSKIQPTHAAAIESKIRELILEELAKIDNHGDTEAVDMPTARSVDLEKPGGHVTGFVVRERDKSKDR